MSVVRQARRLFSQSLVPSVPQMAQGRRPLLKGVVFSTCLAGLLYQTSVFLSIYFAHPTVVVMETTSPTVVEEPAVSVCNRNKRRRSLVCEKEECLCRPMVKEFMCFYYPRLCPNNYGQPYFKIPSTNPLNEAPCSETSEMWMELEQQSHLNNTILSCTKSRASTHQTECQKPYRRFPARETNHPFGINMCYTIGSQIGEPSAVPTYHNTMFHMRLVFRLYPEEYLDPDETPALQILVHDRRALVNPYDGGTKLKGGVQYNAFVSMTEKLSLPPPFATNCVDYEAQWRENNGTGPLDQKACIEYCKMSSLKQRGACMDRLIIYPHQEPLCEIDSIKLTEAIVKNCTDYCGNSCNEKSYEVRYEEMGAYVLKSENGVVHECGAPVHVNLPCEASAVVVEVYFNQYTLTSISHYPKFDSIALFSYLGGFLGIWVGISLVAIFDFFETLAVLMCFACKTHRQRRRIVRVIRKFDI